jgi:hypothetical protein
VTWMRMMGMRREPAQEGAGAERRRADVLEFPAARLPSEFEVFAERARLLG